MEEGSGTSLTNIGSASGLTATLTGTPIWSAAGGKFGAGLTLNGSSQYGTIAAAAEINGLPLADFSIGFWIKPTDTNVVRQLAGKTHGGSTGWICWSSQGAGDPMFVIHHDTTSAIARAAPYSLTAGQWARVGFTWTVATKTARIHINGREAPLVQSVAGSGTYASDTSYGLVLGTSSAGYATSSFYGTINDAHIYTSALDADGSAQAAGLVPSTAYPVVVVRKSSTSFVVRTLLASGGATGEYVEHQFSTTTGNVWRISGLSVARWSTAASFVLSEISSVWEWAWKMGATASASGVYDFVGFDHGSTTRTSWTFTVDGTDITTIATGDHRFGSSLVSTQGMSAVLPEDGVTTAGSATTTHTWASAGLTIAHTHTVPSGVSVITGYAAMLPISGLVSGLQYGTIAGKTERGPFVGDATVYDSTNGTGVAATFRGSGPYTATVTLPDNGPDTSGDWANTQAESGQALLIDSAGNAKVYFTYISGSYAQRKQGPFSSSHRAIYTVAKP